MERREMEEKDVQYEGGDLEGGELYLSKILIERPCYCVCCVHRPVITK